MERTIFDVNTGGDSTYVNLLGQKNGDGTFDVFVSTMTATFKIAPDIFYLRSSTCAFFCLFSESHVEVKTVPHALTGTDIEALFDYFDTISYETFIAYLQ